MNAAAVERIVALFESFGPRDVQRLGAIYCEDALFKDPFNEVQGLPAIQDIYRRMFASLHQPRFAITCCTVEGRDCWLAWEFQFRFRSMLHRRTQTVRGASHLSLHTDGRIAVHRDYWDAADEVYEKLPLLGVLMRWLKRRAGA